MFISDPEVFTPYSTITLIDKNPDLVYWVPELDRDRIYSYQKYEEIYWSHKTALQLAERGDEDDVPIFIPAPMTVVDTTAHFWMKGLKITLDGKDASENDTFQDFLDRELVVPRFHVAKHSGVTRGDFLMHLTADPSKPSGGRISLTSVDPALYFPTFDDDDVEKLLSVRLADSFTDAKDPTKTRMRVLEYKYVVVDGRKRVSSQEAIFEVENWWKEEGDNYGQKRVKLDSLTEEHLLPARITTIPVYHFKNKEWQGWEFGVSELKGFESLIQGIDQGTTDEGMALALEGLGVYATTSGPPVDENGNKQNWHIAPGWVMELDDPTSTFRRVEGVNSVKPFQEHMQWLANNLYEATATFRGGQIDAKVAESGISLAIQFLPTAAKLEQRDTAGVGKLKQLWFDWKNWMFEYEGVSIKGEIDVVLGDKLPTNKQDLLNAWNNMVDRKAVPKSVYREAVAELYGLEMPDDIDELLAKEAQEAFEDAQKRAMLGIEGGGARAPENRAARNGDRPNESAGTEANQNPSQQTRR